MNDLFKEICCNCGIAFWIEREWHKRLVEEKRNFHCPSGHSQRYTGKTEEQVLREQVELKDGIIKRKDNYITGIERRLKLAERKAKKCLTKNKKK